MNDRHPHRRFGVDQWEDVLLTRERAAGRLTGLVLGLAGLPAKQRAVAAAGLIGHLSAAWWVSEPAASHGRLRWTLALLALAATIFAWVIGSERTARRHGTRPATAFKDLAPYAAAWTAAPLITVFLSSSFAGWAAGGAVSAALSTAYHLWSNRHHGRFRQPDLSAPSDRPGDASDLVWDAPIWKLTRGGETRNAVWIDGSSVSGRVEAGEGTDLWIAAAALASDPTRWEVRVRPEGADPILTGSLLSPRENPSDRTWHETLMPLPAGTVRLEASGGPAAACAVRTLSRRKRPRKVLLIVVDGVPAGVPGFAGGSAGVTPGIDRLAGDGRRYTRAYSQGNWTLPSFMSMLTSELPSRHGIFDPRKVRCLADGLPTLPERFRSHGFATRAFFTHKRLVPHYGFARGFDVHRHAQCDRASGRGTADEVGWAAIDALDLHRDHDLFMMLHFFDVHEPWRPRPGYAGRYGRVRPHDVSESEKVEALIGDRRLREDALKSMRASIDEELRRVDVRVGAVVDALKSAGHYEDAVIAVTADHGTRTADPDRLTAYSLTDESVHVPLVIKYPGDRAGSGSRIDRPVAAGIDLGPTLLEAAGLLGDGERWGSGRALGGDRSDGDRCVLSEQIYHGRYSVRARTRDRLCIWSCGIGELRDRRPDAELPAGREVWHDPADPNEDRTVDPPGPDEADPIRKVLRETARNAFCNKGEPS